MGIGDWGLGIGDWGLGPIPNPQSPIPNPQSPMIYNQSLSLLFSQPEVKKYLSGGNIKLKLKKENLQKNNK